MPDRTFPDLPQGERVPWIEMMPDAERSRYDAGMQEAYEEVRDSVTEIISQFIPEIEETDPDLLQALATRWVYGLRMQFEAGVQAGLELSDQLRRPIHEWNQMVARNHIGNPSG